MSWGGGRSSGDTAVLCGNNNKERNCRYLEVKNERPACPEDQRPVLQQLCCGSNRADNTHAPHLGGCQPFRATQGITVTGGAGARRGEVFLILSREKIILDPRFGFER